MCQIKLMFHQHQYVALAVLILVMGVNCSSGSHNSQKNQQQQQQQVSTSVVAGAVPGSGTVAASTNNGEVFAAKSFPLLPEEPTCEQLRAMWIFSKRQSRAAELTNEIPTFRDPFAYNVWNPYYATAALTGASGSRAGLDGLQMVTSRHHSNTRSPVFGRVVSQEPVFPPNLAASFGGSNANGKLLMQYPKMSSSLNADSGKRPVLTSQMRYVGGSPTNNGANNNNNNNALAVQGSFHKLKELIWTERAKELTQQRRLEEMAARAAVLKEIANGQNMQSPYKQQQFQQLHQSDSMLMDENRSPEVDANAGADNARQRFMPGNKSQPSQDHETIESQTQQQLQKTPLRGTYRHTKNRGGANRQKLYYRGYGGGRGHGPYQRPFSVAPYVQRPTSYDIDTSDDKTYESFKREHDLSETDGQSEDDEVDETMDSKPRWRNSAGGIIRKYTKPRAGGSHFRERQRSLLKQYPMDKYYQRMTRGSHSINYDIINNDNGNGNENENEQFMLINDILQKLRENYNDLNNQNDDNINLNELQDFDQDKISGEEDILVNDDY